MSDHTPNTAEICEAYITWAAWKASPSRGRAVAEAEFDRWHDRLMSDQWEDGYDAGRGERTMTKKDAVADVVAQFFGPNDSPLDVADALLAAFPELATEFEWEYLIFVGNDEDWRVSFDNLPEAEAYIAGHTGDRLMRRLIGKPEEVPGG